MKLHAPAETPSPEPVRTPAPPQAPPAVRSPAAMRAPEAVRTTVAMPASVAARTPAPAPVPGAVRSAATPSLEGKPRRSTKVWAGRLGARTAGIVEEYTHSLVVDRRLYPEDIEGSLAHAHMLRRVGLLSAPELRALETGLREIRRQLERGEFVFEAGDEDIHTAVERALFVIAGDVAGRLHTARSRNDQVSTDLRMYAKRVTRELMLACAALEEVLARRAAEHRNSLLPGYTHMQRAQVVSLAHHLLAYVEMFQRDVDRLEDAHDHTDVLPLGSGALAGTTLPIDRRAVANELGFERISANSLDAVGDRDFVVEIVSACALIGVHASRLAEELVLWSSTEFGFAELPDAYATGSSLMPQKKNPDVLELARGRSGVVTGALMSLLTMLKGLPLSYNRDLQEDKPAFFSAIDTTLATLRLLAEVMGVVRFDTAAMRAAASDPALLATDVAEYLVVHGVPFREAHTIVGRAVRDTRAQGRTLRDLTLEEWQAMAPQCAADVLDLFDLDTMLRRREVAGGPGPRMVSRQLVRAATLVAKTRRLVPILARQASAAKEVGAEARPRTEPRA